MQKLCSVVFFPFVPAAVIFKIESLGYQLDEMVKEGVGTADILKAKSRLEYLQGLRARLKVNEISAEAFTQLLIQLLLIFIKYSETAILPQQVVENFLPTDDSDIVLFSKSISPEMLLSISALLSFNSLVLGQLHLTLSHKNRFMGFISKKVLLAYYAISTISRLFFFVLLFTPNLGLFDTMHHSRIGSMMIETQVENYSDRGDPYSPGSLHDVIVDIFTNGTVVKFGDKWEEYRLKSPEQFYHFPSAIVVATLPTLMIVHLCLSWLLREKLYYKGVKFVSLGRKILEGLYTWVCPAGQPQIPV